MKKLIDANVILRHLFSDHSEYSEKARKTIAEGAYRKADDFSIYKADILYMDEVFMRVKE